MISVCREPSWKVLLSFRPLIGMAVATAWPEDAGSIVEVSVRSALTEADAPDVESMGDGTMKSSRFIASSSIRSDDCSRAGVLWTEAL